MFIWPGPSGPPTIQSADRRVREHYTKEEAEEKPVLTTVTMVGGDRLLTRNNSSITSTGALYDTHIQYLI